MENLNDVEFGSDKDKEEAPIFVAQRYLNIFRQIHIFGKAKQDQFDDELLALPPVITDFFKRMPGGRLLVEHIEEVKTERGIAFIKANKEDFAEGSGKGPSTAPVAAGGAVAMVGGSITVDDSFAESLAKSMAEAFKQNPMQATVSGGTAVGGGKIDFGGAFDVIAEEIKFSRASLMDVLKETRSITDSVIASQVSISRILEGILSQRSRDDAGFADLHNRIIASQASITRLLEGLNTSTNQKIDGNVNLAGIESRIQNIKNELRTEMEQSIQKMQASLLEEIKNTVAQSSVATKNLDNIVEEAPKGYEQSLGGENLRRNKNTKPQNSSKVYEQQAKPSVVETIKNITSASRPKISEVIKNVTTKREESVDTALKTTTEILGNNVQKNDEINLVSKDITLDDDLSILDDLASIDDINLDNIDNDIEPINTNADINKATRNEPVKNASSNIKKTAGETRRFVPEDDGLAFALPQHKEKEQHADNNKNITIEDDGLDFALPEQNLEFSSDYDNDVSLPENFEDDGLNFNLPQDDENYSTLSKRSVTNDDNAFDDGLSYTLPSSKEQNAKHKDNEVTLSNLDEDLINNTNLDFNDETSIATDDIINDTFEDKNILTQDDDADTLRNLEAENNTNEIINTDEEIGLNDDFLTDNIASQEEDMGIDDFLSASSEESNVEEEIVERGTYEEDIDINDFLSASSEESNAEEETIEQNTQDNLIEDIVSPQSTPTQSRYSQELDKIRQALTQDDIDISSLNEPIALDDYADDENVEGEGYEVETSTNNTTETTPSFSNDDDDDDGWGWEYEYVDENGNPVDGDTDDEEWEWEYVEEEDTTSNDNKTQ